jgi:hypothetical protein
MAALQGSSARMALDLQAGPARTLHVHRRPPSLSVLHRIRSLLQHPGRDRQQIPCRRVRSSLQPRQADCMRTAAPAVPAGRAAFRDKVFVHLSGRQG